MGINRVSVNGEIEMLVKKTEEDIGNFLFWVKNVNPWGNMGIYMLCEFVKLLI